MSWQDAEKEKASLVQQAETVIRQKNEVDNEQKALLQQMNAIKEQLNEFEGRRNEKNVRCNLFANDQIRLHFL